MVANLTVMDVMDVSIILSTKGLLILLTYLIWPCVAILKQSSQPEPT